MSIMLALALTSLADVLGTIDRVCMPYTAHGATAEAGDQAALAEHYSKFREQNDTRIFRKGEILLSLGTLFGERFCQIDVPGNFVAELTAPSAAAASQRSLASDTSFAPDLRWAGPAGSIYLSFSDEGSPVTILTLIGRNLQRTEGMAHHGR